MMDSMLASRAVAGSVSVVEFNIFFNAMARSAAPDSAQRSAAYFARMTDELRLAPDVVLFATLLKGCRGARGTLCFAALALAYWRRMRSEFGVEPNALCFTELIACCARANDPKLAKLATSLFAQYIQRLQRGAV